MSVNPKGRYEPPHPICRLCLPSSRGKQATFMAELCLICFFARFPCQEWVPLFFTSTVGFKLLLKLYVYREENEEAETLLLRSTCRSSTAGPLPLPFVVAGSDMIPSMQFIHFEDSSLRARSLVDTSYDCCRMLTSSLVRLLMSSTSTRRIADIAELRVCTPPMLSKQ
jgi:hypothetical protein